MTTRPTPPAPGPDATALARADLLLLVARLLAAPSAAHRDGLDHAEGLRSALLERAGLADRPPLVEALARALAAARSVDLHAWCDERTRLFEGPAPCPVNETAYVRRDKGVLLSDICGFYLAFGFDTAEASGEKPDHLAAELEFLAVLHVMLAGARDSGDAEAEAVTGDALRAFARDHLGEWIGLFARRLAETTALDLFRHVAALIEATWEALAESLELPPGGEAGPAAAEEAGSPYECGMVEQGSLETPGEDWPEPLVTLTGPPGSGLPCPQALDAGGDGSER